MIRQDPEAAAKDFRDRIKNYEKVYQTIDESEKQYSYVKVVDLGWAPSREMTKYS
jgi:6-phosphofructo-2-kinase / fructose-2,6-biphosphatase 2